MKSVGLYLVDHMENMVLCLGIKTLVNLNFDLVYTTDIYKSRLLICGLYSNTWPISDASIETFTKYVETIFVGQKHPTLRIEWTFNLFLPKIPSMHSAAEY